MTESEQKTTPGSWEVLNDGRILGGPVGDDGLRTMVAHVALGDEEGRANARLIACAPEMLAALKDIFGFLRAHGYNTDLVKSVIARAEGRE